MDLVGNYLYVVTETDFRILDITNINSITELDILKSDDFGLIQIKNDIAYITKDAKSDDNPPFLYSFDVSNPAKIKIYYSFYYLYRLQIIIGIVIGAIAIPLVSAITIRLVRIIKSKNQREDGDKIEDTPQE